MKNFVAVLVLVVLTCGGMYAQNGNCGNNGNGPGNGNPANGTGGWGSGQYLVSWLENGGSIPQPVAIAVIHEARVWGQQNFGLSLGQMIQKYNQGLLTVEFMYTSPPSLTFRVGFGGIEIAVILDGA
jgi:hypothetical protein